jgi:hypothetical protein
MSDMSSLESEGAREALTGDTTAPTGLAAPRGEAKAHTIWARALAIVGGLLAGLVSFGVGEAVYQLIPAELVKVRDGVNGQPVMGTTDETLRAAAGKNASVAFGALGLCLGGFLGAAGGLARRSTKATLTGGLLGIVLGAALGAGVSGALVPYLIKAQDAHHDQEIIIALVMHGVIWGLLGAAAGLAFAVALGERRYIARAVVGGLVGALLGAVAFDFIGAALFTSANTHFAISETATTRLLARLLVALATAAMLAVFLTDAREAGPRPR